MKKINKIIIWVIAVMAGIFIILNLIVPSFARKIIVEQIEENFKLKTSLSGVNITPPFSINLIDLKIGDLFQADRVSVSPNILGFFAGKIVLSGVALINPVIRVEQSKEGKFNIPQLEQKAKQPPVYITGLALRNGKVIFNDKKASPEGFVIILSRINADISKVILPPTSLKTNFKVSGDFLRPDNKKIGSINFFGWLDFGPKNMDGTLEIKNLDITYFSPYYGSFISSKKLLSAKLNTKTTFKSQNNNLDTLTNLKLSNLVYAKYVEDVLDVPSLSLARNALDFFTDTKGNLDLEFDISTKLDNPSISIEQLEKVILKAAVRNLANQNPEDLIKKINDNIEQFKGFGKGLEKIFKNK
ncbi:MAG: DUF748 domain-containing protein [Candidatus Omnitrophota bacterium]